MVQVPRVRAMQGLLYVWLSFDGLPWLAIFLHADSVLGYICWGHFFLDLPISPTTHTNTAHLRSDRKCVISLKSSYIW